MKTVHKRISESTIDAEGFTIEIQAGRQPIPFIEVDVEGSAQALRLNTKVTEKALGDIAEVSRFLEKFASSVTEHLATPGPQLIAFGVASKIVVVVNDQDSGARMLLAIEICSREPAGAATDDYKVVEICIGLLHRAPIAPAFQRELMGDLE
jgi:hypothetical protein